MFKNESYSTVVANTSSTITLQSPLVSWRLLSFCINSETLMLFDS